MYDSIALVSLVEMVFLSQCIEAKLYEQAPLNSTSILQHSSPRRQKCKNSLILGPQL